MIDDIRLSPQGIAVAYAANLSIFFMEFLPALPSLLCFLAVVKLVADLALAPHNTASTPIRTTDLDRAKADAVSSSDPAALMQVALYLRHLGAVVVPESHRV